MFENVTVIQLIMMIVGIFGAFLAGVKWVDKKKENTDKSVSILRQQVVDGQSSLADDISRLRIETTSQISALDLKSAERYATWQAFKEFKDDLKSDLNSRFDRHERSTREQFDRLFDELKRTKEQGQ